MKRWLRFGAILFTILWAMISGGPNATAFAQPREAVVSQQSVTVARGQTVEDVVVLGHNATISGDVSEILLVVNGDIHLTSSAYTGMVVDLGGTITQDPGAHVNAIYRASLSTPFWNGVLFGASLMALLWLGMLAISIGMLVISVTIAWALRNQVNQPVLMISQSVKRAATMGFFLTLVFLALASLLALSIIGIPVAALLAGVYLVTGTVGFSVVSTWIGKLATRHSPTKRPVWQLGLIGSGLVIALVNVPVVGWLIFCMVWFVGVGAIVQWLSVSWRTRRKRIADA